MVGERRLFPAEVVQRIRAGGDPARFGGFSTIPGGSYTSQWWMFHDDHGAYAARGVHGQTIYIDPTAEMVLVRFASHPRAQNGVIDPTSLPAYRGRGRFPDGAVAPAHKRVSLKNGKPATAADRAMAGILAARPRANPKPRVVTPPTDSSIVCPISVHPTDSARVCQCENSPSRGAVAPAPRLGH
jgi:hypothetical protein